MVEELEEFRKRFFIEEFHVEVVEEVNYVELGLSGEISPEQEGLG
jgi:hypothetical protein